MRSPIWRKLSCLNIGVKKIRRDYLVLVREGMVFVHDEFHGFSKQRLHGEILKVALARQKKLLAGFSEDEVRAFTGYLARFLSNLEVMGDD